MLCVKAPGDPTLRWRPLDSSTHRLVGSIDRLYQAYFGRAADSSGFAYWINLRIDGVPLVAISESFAASPEFPFGVFHPEEIHDDGAEQVVDRVYAHVLHRPPDDDGFGYWVDLLYHSSITPGQMMVAISQSPEFRERTGTI